uniref:Uncharacterized protein n=1 Tax=Ditylenchus dipsaci TaxID=166011 RepID=A0A915EW13_9BILA
MPFSAFPSPVMDVTTVHNIMSSFWPRGIPLTTTQNQLLSAAIDHHHQQHQSNYSTTSNMMLSPQGPSREPQPHHFGQIRISPTMAVIDAQYGLPTASVAESPRFSAAMMDPMEHGLSALTSRSALPPTSNNSVIVSRGCCPPSAAPTPPALEQDEEAKSSVEEMLAEALGWSVDGDNGVWDLDSSSECATSTNTDSSGQSKAKGALLCQVCSDNASGFHYGINRAFSVALSNKKFNTKRVQKTRDVQLCDPTGIDASFAGFRNVWQWACPEM